MLEARCNFIDETDSRLVAIKKVAMTHTWNPSFDPSITVPVFKLNRLAHCFSRQR